jgi:predicted DNA-binding transcriptional regulator YafY
MPQTGRLFDLIQILRDGRLHTARDLAARLEVSTRTIWRDMLRLQASGVPVEGERGMGYMLRETVDLPPLTLTGDEVAALRLGAVLVARGADPGLARAADSLRAKVETVLPARIAAVAVDPVFVFTGAEAESGARHLPALRCALREGLRVTIDYAGADGAVTRRALRPLQLEFWGRVWTLAAFCEMRGDFRSFRLDRIAAMTVGSDRYPQEPGRGLADYLLRVAPGSGGPSGRKHETPVAPDHQPQGRTGFGQEHPGDRGREP